MSSILVALGAWTTLAAATPAPPPWLTPGLTADPKAIAAAAAAYVPAPDETDETLDEDVTFRFDAQGRRTTTYRTVRLMLMQQGVEANSVVRMSYEPWHQQRPVIKARVITRDGVAHVLDPATLVEAGDGEGPGPVFSDVRVVSGPLPSVVPGAVIEEEISRTDTAPYFPAGTAIEYRLGDAVRVEHTRVTLIYPPSLPVRYSVRGIALKPQVTTADGMRVVRFEQWRLAGYPQPEPFMPPDVTVYPSITVSTGKSWTAVAKAYADVVDQKLAHEDLSALARSVIGPHASRDHALAKVAAWIPTAVRYTGLEPGDSSIIPTRPSETVARQYGDCKDLATLAVGLLRAAGVPAEVALIQVRGFDLDKDLPGLGPFDHAIVHLPGTPERWYDATAGLAPPGEIPDYDQGQYALVAAPRTQKVVRTPVADAAQNRLEVETTYRMAELDDAVVTERQTIRGSEGRALRAALLGHDAESTRQSLGESIRNRYLAEKVVKLETSDPHDVGLPLEVRSELADSRRAVTSDDSASAIILRLPLLQKLPDFFDPPSSDDAQRPGRTRPMQLPEAIDVRWNYRVIPPPGFVMRAMPADQTRALGPASLSARFLAQPDGSATATLEFQAPRRLSAVEALALRDAVDALRAEPGVQLSMDRKGALELAQGDYRGGIAEYVKLTALHPKEAAHQAQLAMALLNVGMGGPAREHARTAVELDPNWGGGHRIYGFILEHDLVGRDGKPGCDLQGSLEQYRRAAQLDDKDARAYLGQARALLRLLDAAKDPKAKDDLQGEAIVQMQKLRELDAHDLDLPLLTLLYRAKRFAEVRELAAKLPASAARNGMWLAAVAHLDGVAAVVPQIDRMNLSAQDRQVAEGATIGVLLTGREYGLARAVVQHTGVALGSLEAMIRSVEVLEGARISTSDPKALLGRAALLTFRPDASDKEWQELVAASPRKLRERVKDDVEELRKHVYPAQMVPLALADLVTAGVEATVEQGAKGAYRVRLQPRNGGDAVTWFAMTDHDKLRLVGTSHAVDGLGALALQRLDAGDLDGARAWLNWAQAERPAEPNAIGFSHYWPPPAGAEPTQSARLAAAALGADVSPQANQILEAAYQATPAGPDRAQLAAAWMLTRIVEQVDRTQAQARLAEAAPLFEPQLRYWIEVAFAPDRKAKCALSRARLQESPGDLEAAGMQFSCIADEKGIPAAIAFGQAFDAAGRGSSHILNEIVWAELFVPTPPEVLTTAVDRLSNGGDAAIENTIAAADAELGRLPDARSHFLRSIENEDEIQDADWLVYGRMAERIGFKEEARAAYRRIKAPQKADQRSPYALAQKWLAQLDK